MVAGAVRGAPGGPEDPPPGSRFPLEGFEFYVDHDGTDFRFFSADPAEPGRHQELTRGDYLERIQARLAGPDPTLAFVAAALALTSACFVLDLPRLSLFFLLITLPVAAFLNSDSRRKRQVRIWYDSERPAIAARLEAVQAVLQALAGCRGFWPPDCQVPGRTPEGFRIAPSDRGLMQVRPAIHHLDLPPRTVWLLPDQILAWSNGRLIGSPYRALTGVSETVRRSIPGPVPSDSPRLGTRWKHMTKKGLPDKRYSYNPEQAVVAFGSLRVRAGDLDLHLETSNPEAARTMAERLQALVRLDAGAAPAPPVAPPLTAASRPYAPPPPPVRTARPPSPPAATPSPVTAASRPTAPPNPAPTSTPPETVQWARSKARWVPPGAEVTVAGRKLPGGMLYVGAELVSSWSRLLERALINPDLPVDWNHPDREAARMGYWPNYTRITPQERAAYLEWLAGGRKDPEASLGFVFLFFYGLEWRVMLESLHAPELRQEWPLLAAELQRLQAVYGPRHASFQSYCQKLLEVLELRTDLGSARAFTPACGIPLNLRVVLSLLSRTEKPLPAETAFAWALSEPECSLNPRLMRCGDLLANLFTLRYRQQNPEGLTVPPHHKPLSLGYRAAFEPGREIPLAPLFGDLTDVAEQRAPLQPLRRLLSQCSEELDAYSRYLGRHPEGHRDPAALALLPGELVDQVEGPELKQLRLFLKARLSESDHAAVPVPELLALWPTRTPGRLDKAEALALAQYLHNQEIGLEPDIRFGATVSSFQQQAVAFPLPQGSPTAPSQAYQAAALVLQCAATVSASDGSISPEEEAHLLGHLQTALDLTPGERQRLQARLRWLLLQPPSVTGLKKHVQALDTAQRQALAEFLVLTATADGRIDPAEVNALKKFYAMLELDEASLYSRLHQVSAETSGPAPAAQARPDGNGNGALRLDPALLERRMAETHALTSLLATVFTEEGPAPAPVPLIPVEPAARVADLDPAHSRFFLRLADRPRWSRAQVEELAAELGLMPDGALDRLNEAALEACGEPLLDGEDPVLVDLDLAKEISGEH